MVSSIPGILQAKITDQLRNMLKQYTNKATHPFTNDTAEKHLKNLVFLRCLNIQTFLTRSLHLPCNHFAILGFITNVSVPVIVYMILWSWQKRDIFSQSFDEMNSHVFVKIFYSHGAGILFRFDL